MDMTAGAGGELGDLVGCPLEKIYVVVIKRGGNSPERGEIINPKHVRSIYNIAKVHEFF